MEHLNRSAKACLSGLGSNITDNSVQCIGRCIGKVRPIIQQFDDFNSIPSQSGCHSHRSKNGELDKIVTQLSETTKVFQRQAGLTHRQFPQFKSNITHKTSLPQLELWMRRQFNKMLTYY